MNNAKSNILLVALCTLSLAMSGCAFRRAVIRDGDIVRGKLYRVPVPKDKSWFQIIPFGAYDSLYMRCPSDQKIAVIYKMLCGKYDYARMAADDYSRRLYLGEPDLPAFFCPEGGGDLHDRNFKGLIGTPELNLDAYRFTITYETSASPACGPPTSDTVSMKGMDVFVEDRNTYFYGGAHTRFVIFRYLSPSDQFEGGLKEFQDLVSGFEWIKEK
jgi:hypothetical protein